MMPRVFTSLPSFALLLVPSVAPAPTPAPAPAGPFSAEITQTAGGQTATGTFSYQDKSYRFDLTSNGQQAIVLFDGTTGVTRLLTPQDKSYIQPGADDPMALLVNPFAAYATLARKNSVRTEGTASIAGIACRKQVVFSGEQVLLTACVSDDFDVPLKVEIPVYGIVVELRNVKRGPQPVALFRVPDGYKLKAMQAEPEPQPEWASKVARAPLLAPPFERTMAEGDIVRVRTQAGRSIAIEGVNAGKAPGSFTAAPFKGGKSLGASEMGTYEVNAGDSGTMTVGAQPPGTDEIIIRVGKGPLKIKATYVQK
jgi:hypothetical protein